MFLKQEPLDIKGQSVTLSELSALQRIEYLEFLTHQDNQLKHVPDEASAIVRQTAYLRMSLEINAWLLSRSMWHQDRSSDVCSLYSLVLNDWAPDALSHAASRVLVLSGMVPSNDAQEEDGAGDEQARAPEKS